MKKSKKYWIVLFAAFLAACTYNFPEIEEPTEQDLGELNVEKVIAVGDGFLGGAMDGALYSEGQHNSVASIVVTQLNQIKKIEFDKAEINTENGYNFYFSTESAVFGKWKYEFKDNQQEEPDLVLSTGEPVLPYSGDKSNLEDVTVPLFQTKNLHGTSYKFNPYFSRSYDLSTSISPQIIDKSPTLVLLWIGINDYLEYAMNGATEEEMLIQYLDFAGNIQTLIHQLLLYTEAKIVIGNLLPINDFPFFYLNQYNFIRLSNAEKAAAQAHYSNYNSAVAAFNVGKQRDDWRQMISFEDNGSTLYPQPIVVIDNNLPDASYPDGSPLEKFRQLIENEMALFSITPKMVIEGFGSKIPLSNEFYLSENQIEDINNRTEAFNQIIFNVEQLNTDRVVIVDISSEVSKVAQTGRIDSWGFVESNDFVYAAGVPLEARLEQNSIYSLDAIHFNQRGNAFIANVFIETINSKFNANIPLAQINDYIGNVYEFSSNK